MKTRYIIYIFLIIGFSYAVYYRINANKQIEGEGGGPKGGAKGANKSDKPKPPTNVEGIVVSTSTFDSDLEVSGNIEANESVVLRSEVSGLVTGIFFKEGTSVSKGAVLVRINDREIQAQLREAMTKQNLSATNESRAKQLLQKGAISEEEYETAFADLQSLKAQTQLIKAQLQKTVISAPFSGKIGLRGISVGEYLTPASVIANLSSINPVKISFSVPEKYVNQVKINSSFTFNTNTTQKTYQGKVFALEPGINQQTRTVQIKGLAANTNNELIPGSFAKVKLKLSTITDAILIPSQAVIPTLKGKMVYLSINGIATPVEIEAGARTSESVLVTSGLKIGDTVLTTGTMSIKPEAAIKVKIAKN
jgi:membrane fusion protein (multidrug efflux system)